VWSKESFWHFTGGSYVAGVAGFKMVNASHNGGDDCGRDFDVQVRYSVIPDDGSGIQDDLPPRGAEHISLERSPLSHGFGGSRCQKRNCSIIGPWFKTGKDVSDVPISD
jgi:hypothetical protein